MNISTLWISCDGCAELYLFVFIHLSDISYLVQVMLGTYELLSYVWAVFKEVIARLSGHCTRDDLLPRTIAAYSKQGFVE